MKNFIQNLISAISVIILVMGGIIALGKKKPDNNSKKPKQRVSIGNSSTRSNAHQDDKKLFINEYKTLKQTLEDATISNPEKKQLSNFQTGLSKCFAAWKDINVLKKRESKANIILTAYYSKNKIRNQFQGFCEYVKEEMPDDDSSEIIVNMGYNAYYNFARINYEKMQEQLRTINIEPTNAEDEVLLLNFLYTLALKDDSFSDLYNAFNIGKKRCNGEVIMESDKEIYNLVKSVNTKITNISENDNRFDKILDDLQIQRDKIERNIEEAEELLKSLNKVFDSDDRQVLKDKSLDAQSIKDIYNSKRDLIMEEVLDKYKR